MRSSGHLPLELAILPRKTMGLSTHSRILAGFMTYRKQAFSAHGLAMTGHVRKGKIAPMSFRIASTRGKEWSLGGTRVEKETVR